ncbi:Putative S-adenosyl-L-methionine-dependent methyltransferase [Septoria linicola]|uniref:S-adenosyl-L-methionine-dependent methyltransferase n=1 Tax=Septoria linicola TaxID=215465 RepID=A0A9Q9ELN4_9PEZI|nr:putative S-adenosyl-L-methionine-dependent methyltransferase [Septoria linicola]USW54539.1 Putative S-adenosyl-L-methionine-dependent methyltransferase [Septoria linicola]
MPVPQPENNAVVQYAGRNYPRYALQHQIHCVPVDEEEEQRYDEVNEILQELLGGELRGVVIPPSLHDEDSLEEADVLECGYGKAAWVDKFLAFRPDSLVVGVDIFTGQGTSDEDEEEDDEEDDDAGIIESFIRKRWNLNAPLRQDTSSDRLRPETFDLINSRMLSDGINANRWESYVRELAALLKPNGWLQMVEFHAIFQSDSGREAPFLSRWWDWYSQKMIQMGKNPRVASQLRPMMVSAGLTDVNYYVLRLPIGNWDIEKIQLGMQTRDVVEQMIRDVSLYPFLALGQMPREQYDNLIQGARLELRRPELKLYLNVHVAYGRKSRRRR